MCTCMLKQQNPHLVTHHSHEASDPHRIAVTMHSELLMVSAFRSKRRADTVSASACRHRRCCVTQAGGRSMTPQGQRLQTAPGEALLAACTSRACQKMHSRLPSGGGGRRPGPSELLFGAAVHVMPIGKTNYVGLQFPVAPWPS